MHVPMGGTNRQQARQQGTGAWQGEVERSVTLRCGPTCSDYPPTIMGSWPTYTATAANGMPAQATAYQGISPAAECRLRGWWMAVRYSASKFCHKFLTEQDGLMANCSIHLICSSVVQMQQTP